MQSNRNRSRCSRAEPLPQLVAILTMLSLAPEWASAQPPSARSSSAERPPVANPLDGYIRDALRANLSLVQDQLDEDRAVAAVREARALRLPSLAFSSRKTQVDGGLDLGDLVNP